VGLRAAQAPGRGVRPRGGNATLNNTVEEAVCRFSADPRACPPLSMAAPPSSYLLDIVLSMPWDCTMTCM